MKNFIEYKEYIKESVSIVDVAKKLGVSTTGNTECPTGHDSSSGKCFNVNSKKNTCRCYNCDEGGDMFELLKMANGLEFNEALYWIADTFELEKPTFDKESADHYRRKKMVSNILNESAKLFHRFLINDKEKVDQLISERGWTKETLENNMIGYCPVLDLDPHKRSVMENSLKNIGLEMKHYNDIGLVRLSDRIIFPYLKNGHVVYMAGRADSGLFENNNKYLKLQTNEYVKNDTLLGEDNVKSSSTIFITEGIPDYISGVQAGYPIISPGTTNFSNSTIDKLVSITKDTDAVYIIPDSEDSGAGMEGAKRTANVLQEAGKLVYIVELPREEGVSKIDLCDFLKDNPKEELDKLIAEAKTPGQISIDQIINSSNLDELTLRHKIIPALKGYSVYDVEYYLKYLQEEIKPKFELSKRSINALKKEILSIPTEKVETKKSQENDSKDSDKPIKTAYFENLADIVLDENGETAFLLKEEDDFTVKNVHIGDDEQTYIPPTVNNYKMIIKKKQHFPLASNVLKYIKEDDDSKLFSDLVEYFKGVSQLPSENYYKFIATWSMHTYLYDQFDYTPILWFYAVPGRGKSRTGKSIAYLCWRGFINESLREPNIIRASQHYKATMFFDVVDLQKKMERSNCLDLIMQRYEEGVSSQRVINFDAGAFDDIESFDIFGPTIIATNHIVSHQLSTRTIQITMPKSTQTTYETNIKPEGCLHFKERLIAFRARWLGKELPRVDKPAGSRLGDILQPIAIVNEICNPDKDTWLTDLIVEIQAEREDVNRNTKEGRVITALAKCTDKLEYLKNGEEIIYNRAILGEYNSDINNKNYQLQSGTLGKILKSLGFERRTNGQERGILWDKELFNSICKEYGIEDHDSSNTDGEHKIYFN